MTENGFWQSARQRIKGAFMPFNDKMQNNYLSLARYSLWCAFFGIVSYFFLFPGGMYYCFFLGVMAVTAGILSKRSGLRSGRSTAGIALGIFDVLFSLMAFYGMYLIYSSVSDPVLGPRITAMIVKILEDNGLGIESFVRLMH